MKDKLRELADDWCVQADAHDEIGFGAAADVGRVCAAELLTILDAEGDGGAMACEAMRLLIAIREDDYLSDSSRHRIDTLRNTHTPRSGVVSDEELQAEAEAFAVRAGFTYGWENLESWARQMADRAALEHFARRTP